MATTKTAQKSQNKPAPNAPQPPDNPETPDELQDYDPPMAKPVEEGEEFGSLVSEIKDQSGENYKIASNAPKKNVRVMTDGQIQRRKRAIQIGLSEKILPPYTPGVLATYQIINTKRIDPATNQEPDPKDVTMPGTYMLFDKWEPDPLRKKKMMRNLGRPEMSRDKDGNEIIVDTIKEIEFVAGILRVPVSENYRLFVFMELHPLNKSNRNRSNNNAAYFERTDLKYNKSPQYLAAEMDLAREAEAIVMKVKDKNEIIGMAVSAQVYKPDLDLISLKTELRRFALKDPKAVFRMVTDSKPGIKLDMLDAIHQGFIFNDVQTNTFYLADTNEKICTYLIDSDPIEELVNFIVKKENAPMRENILEQVHYWD